MAQSYTIEGSTGTWEVVCGLEVPWRHDGVREFEEQRRWMHERYLDHARTSGGPWLLAEGPLEQRIEEAADAVEELLSARTASE